MSLPVAPAWAAARIGPVVAHNSYLNNLATAQPELRAQSIAALGEELDRAEVLGLDGLVMHPGSYTSGTEADGLRLIAEGLERLLEERPVGKTMVLLEHTAGQGTNLGHRFEHLAEIIDLKFFCGFSFAEIAAMRNVSERTIQRSWEKGRLYLHHAIDSMCPAAVGMSSLSSATANAAHHP